MPTTLPTVPVTCSAQDQSGAPLASGKFEARLDRLEFFDGFVVPSVVTGYADAQGVCVLDLWPNALGSGTSTYRVRAWAGALRVPYLDGWAAVPNAACALVGPAHAAVKASAWQLAGAAAQPQEKDST